MDNLEAQSTEKVYKPCEISETTNGKFKSNLAQFYMAFIECFFCITQGMLSTMPTIVVGALHNKEGDSMTLDDSAASWIGSILLVCHPCGALSSGVISDKLGRKKTMMLLNIPFGLSWILHYYASSVQCLIFAAAFMGFSIGLSEAPIPSYISESSEPRLRGVFSSAVCAACGLGTTIKLYLGSVFHWRTSALLCLGLNVVSFFLFFTIPESPLWLMTKNRMIDAQKALGWLRGFLEPQHVKKEFEELVRYSKISTALSCKSLNGNLEEKVPLDSKKDKGTGHPGEQITTDSWLKEKYKELTNPKLYVPLRVVLIMFLFTQFAGINPVRTYIVEILNRFWFPVDSTGVLVMTGVANFLGGIGALLLVKQVGKRLLCLGCMIIATISIFMCGLYASFFTGTREAVLAWLFIIALGTIHFVGSVGVLNIPWLFTYEFYPLKGRGLACGISAAASSLISFFLTKTYLQTQHIVGLSGMFYTYGAISLAGCIYVFLYIPETEGKTLEQIETYFTPHHDRKEKFRMPRKNPSKA